MRLVRGRRARDVQSEAQRAIRLEHAATQVLVRLVSSIDQVSIVQVLVRLAGIVNGKCSHSRGPCAPAAAAPPSRRVQSAR